jgi:large subunit ribosomal protein L13
MKELIIDASNATLGRLASYSAKQALLGRKIVILNCSEAVITGERKVIISKYRSLRKKGGGSLKGPKISKVPYMLVKRTIRGMLSHRQSRGSEAFKRIICYNGLPAEYVDSKKIIAGKNKPGKVLKIKDLVKDM